jgi:hypothetical protein
MAAGSTYEPITTYTASGSVNTITFSSIPATYTDLVIVTNVRASVLDSYRMRFNGDTATNYSFTVLRSDGTTPSSYRVSSKNLIELYGVADSNASTLANTIYHIQNYSNTTTYKNALMRINHIGGSSSNNHFEQAIGIWRSTAAINSIELFTVQNFGSNSTFTLYGIAGA